MNSLGLRKLSNFLFFRYFISCSQKTKLTTENHEASPVAVFLPWPIKNTSHVISSGYSVSECLNIIIINFFYQCHFIMLDLLSSLLRITYPLRLPFSCSLMSDVKNLIITKCTKKISIEIKNTNKKWFLWISKGGKAHTLKYIFIWISINHPRMDEAPWCYKWIGWSWVGSLDWDK